MIPPDTRKNKSGKCTSVSVLNFPQEIWLKDMDLVLCRLGSLVLM